VDASGVPGRGWSLRTWSNRALVSGWLAKGRLTSEAVQLVSDAMGGADLVGLPHGQYRGSCALPGGASTLPPGDWGQLEIRLEL
jgi:hypothetical protein